MTPDTPDEQGLTRAEKNRPMMDGPGTENRSGPSDEWIAFVEEQLGRSITDAEMRKLAMARELPAAANDDQAQLDLDDEGEPS